MTKSADIANCVKSGDTRQTAVLVTRAIDENCPAGHILREGLVAGMMETLKSFRKDEVLDQEVLVADQAMNAGLEIVMPILEAEHTAPACTVIIGTLEGDIRTTEKTITSCLMRSLGLKVIDLGTSVSCVRFIEAAIDEKANIIACNASLTTFMPQMKTLVQAADQANIRNKTKTLFSGGPVTEWFCKSINADMYARDIVQAADMAAEYCKKIPCKL
jgi:methanogenic corrinoid protein MtbC1